MIRAVLRATGAGAATSTADGHGPCPTCPLDLAIAAMTKVIKASRAMSLPLASMTGK